MQNQIIYIYKVYTAEINTIFVEYAKRLMPLYINI